MFFTEREEGKSNVGHTAKKVCRACPVRKSCLTYAIEQHEEHGIWGGYGEKDRRYLNRKWNERECDGWGWAWSDVNCSCSWCQALLEAVRDDTVFNSNGPNATHGLRVTYARGCRCFPCKMAASKYSLEQKGKAA